MCDGAQTSAAQIKPQKVVTVLTQSIAMSSLVGCYPYLNKPAQSKDNMQDAQTDVVVT